LNDSMKIILVVLVAAGLCGAGGYFVGSAGSERDSLKFEGSTTLQPLMDKYSETYEKSTSIDLEIVGGGSQKGVDAVKEGRVDIGMSSRDVGHASHAGLDEIKIGTDAIVAIVNITGISHNQITLTKAQLASIYKGEITNWKDITGAGTVLPDIEIKPIMREAGSGTRDGFESIIGTGDMSSKNYPLQSSTGAMITAVNQTAGAIGYISLASLTDECKAVKYDAGEGGIAASPEAVLDGTYLLVRDLVLLVKPDMNNAAAEFFLNWVLGAQGQSILAENGFVPL